MDVAVIIVNWNSGLLLRDCLASLCKQTLQPDQVIVVDNASSDGSADCVSELKDYRLIRADTNLGFAAGNNLALRQTQAKYVVLLNPDTCADPSWLENLVRAANAYPESAAFGSRQMLMDTPDYVDGTGDVVHVSGLVWRHRHGRKIQSSDLVPREIFSPCAAAALYRKAAIDAVGGFDESYFCYVEDVDLGFRLQLVGFRARYVPDALVFHKGSALTGGQHSAFAVYHGHRNLVWTYVKNLPGMLLWLLLPLHLMMNLAALVGLTLRGRGGDVWKAKCDALLGLPKVLEARAQIQAQRKISNMAVWALLDKTPFKWGEAA